MNPLLQNIDESWVGLLHSLIYQEPLIQLLETLDKESYEPKKYDIFNVFKVPLDDIKLVILCSEPYPVSNFNNGLALHTNPKTKQLRLVEETILRQDKDNAVGGTVTIDNWSKQGVFLLNTALTVRINESGSHLVYWEKFIRTIIQYISSQNPCTWLFLDTYTWNFVRNLKNPFALKYYDKETINYLPIFEDKNYYFKVNEKLLQEMNVFYLLNKVLEMSFKTKIKW